MTFFEVAATLGTLSLLIIALLVEWFISSRRKTKKQLPAPHKHSTSKKIHWLIPAGLILFGVVIMFQIDPYLKIGNWFIPLAFRTDPIFFWQHIYLYHSIQVLTYLVGGISVLTGWILIMTSGTKESKKQ